MFYYLKAHNIYLLLLFSVETNFPCCKCMKFQMLLEAKVTPTQIREEEYAHNFHTFGVNLQTGGWEAPPRSQLVNYRNHKCLPWVTNHHHTLGPDPYLTTWEQNWRAGPHADKPWALPKRGPTSLHLPRRRQALQHWRHNLITHYDLLAGIWMLATWCDNLMKSQASMPGGVGCFVPLHKCCLYISVGNGNFSVLAHHFWLLKILFM